MQAAKRFKKDENVEVGAIEIEKTDQLPFIDTRSVPYLILHNDFTQKPTETSEFETLEITDIPSIQDTVNLISGSTFLENFYQSSYSIAVSSKISARPISQLSPLQYDIVLTNIDKTKKLLLWLESSVDDKSCFYWKNSDDDKLLMLSLIDLELEDKKSMSSFVFSFLLLALRFGNDGLSQEAKHSASTELSLYSLADVNDKNLLMLAAELGNRPVVSDLLKLGFDINHQVDNQIAADLAWQNRHLDVLFVLLLENSLYPMDFTEAPTSNCEMKDLVRATHQIMKSVRNGDESMVQQICEKFPNLRYFYSSNNVSAAFLALSREKFHIYKIFMSHNVCVGPKEDIDRILSRFNDQKREELRKIHLEYAREPPEKFLMILHSNTSVGHDTININEKLDFARNAIEYLFRIPGIRLILQIVAASRDFKLVFDFNRDSVQFLDPTSSKQTRGSFFTSRQIYIAAKYLLDPAQKQEAIGTLAHELCHYAMFLVYKNSCLPYFNGDHKMARMFHGIMKLCHENRKKEKIVGHVFDIPKENQESRHAELIVRVPHLMALYHEDQEQLDRCHELFLPLFNFWEFKIVEDMKVALPNIETVGDEEVKKFNDKRKKKGFFRLRNFLILAILVGIVAIAAVTVAYFYWPERKGNELSGDVRMPWNAIILNSRTEELMCIGTLIHTEFVLSTAECVFRRGHQRPLPPELFLIDLNYADKGQKRTRTIQVFVHNKFNPNIDEYHADLALLELEIPQQITKNFYPIKFDRNPAIPVSESDPRKLILHTFLDGHSINVDVGSVSSKECILDDFELNRYLAVEQICLRRSVLEVCLTDRGEQYYEKFSNGEHILLGIVSRGQQHQENCDREESVIVTDLKPYKADIQNRICNGNSPESPWQAATTKFGFVAGVMDLNGKFLCWSTRVSGRLYITDSSCIVSYKASELVLNTTEYLFKIEEIVHHKLANFAKIITLDFVFKTDPILPNENETLESLYDVSIIYGQEAFEETLISKYYKYQNLHKKNIDRLFSNLCIQVKGGPIFTDDGEDMVKIHGIIVERNCRNDCNGHNRFEILRLYDYMEFINSDIRDSVPDEPVGDEEGFIRGVLDVQPHCRNGVCLRLLIFNVHHVPPSPFRASRQSETPSSFPIFAVRNESVQGLSMMDGDDWFLWTLPSKVDEIFPNLIVYLVRSVGIHIISGENFKNLSRLMEIELIECNIQEVQFDAFVDLVDLRFLDLSGNQIVHVDSRLLQSLVNLEQFSLRKNQIQDEPDIFVHNRVLKDLDLSDNKIFVITNNILLNCTSLESIRLNTNQLIIINPANFHSHSINFVDLRGNICIEGAFGNDTQGNSGLTNVTQHIGMLDFSLRACWTTTSTSNSTQVPTSPSGSTFGTTTTTPNFGQTIPYDNWNSTTVSSWPTTNSSNPLDWINSTETRNNNSTVSD